MWMLFVVIKKPAKEAYFLEASWTASELLLLRTKLLLLLLLLIRELKLDVRTFGRVFATSVHLGSLQLLCITISWLWADVFGIHKVIGQMLWPFNLWGRLRHSSIQETFLAETSAVPTWFPAAVSSTLTQ